MTQKRLILPLASGALGLAAALCATVPAHATVILSLDLHQLVGRSDQIFVGKVLSTAAHWTADRRHIVTDATVVVERGVHGGAQPGQQVVVRRLGGSVAGIGMRVAGVAVLSKDDQVLLFTELRQGHRFVVGMRQGLFTVYKGAAGQLLLRRQLSGLSLVDRTPDGMRAASATTATMAAPPERLDKMITRLGQVVGECRAQPSRCQLEQRRSPRDGE